MRSNLAKTIGKQIKLYRESHLGISQEELAHRAGVHVTHLSRLECGARMGTLDTLLRICHSLGVTLAQVLPPEKKPALPSDPVSAEILRIVSKRSLSDKKTILRIVKSYISKGS